MYQATFDTVSISPPPADKRYPRASMKEFKGTKEEEVAVLRHLLPKDAFTPFKGPLNIKLQDYEPHNGLTDAVYKELTPLLYNTEMSDLDTYIFIQDLLKATFRATAVDINLNTCRDSKPETHGRYVYSATLVNYLLLPFKSNCT